MGVWCCACTTSGLHAHSVTDVDAVLLSTSLHGLLLQSRHGVPSPVLITDRMISHRQGLTDDAVF